MSQKCLFAAIVAVLFGVGVIAQTVPSLVNYQGRLTDQTGGPLTPGAYSIQFRLWDTPTGSNILVWAQQQTLTVQSNGVFNVILGAPGGSAIAGAAPAVNDLTFAFTSSNRFFGLTVVSNNGVAIPTPSEILPRQQFLSVPFALNAASVIPGAIGSPQIAAGAILTSHIADGAVTQAKLAQRPTGTTVPVGGFAVSGVVSNFNTGSTSFVPVTGLTVTITTTGRPVYVGLRSLATGNPNTGASMGVRSGSAVYFELRDQTTALADYTMYVGGTASIDFPPSAISHIYLPPPGTYTFTLSTATDSGRTAYVSGQLIAFEL